MYWLIFALVTQYQPPRAGTTLADPAQEQRAARVGKTIRCAVCQGLSVADSPSPMAQAMMDRIRDQVSEGKSDDDIRAFFEQRYGEFILLSPKATGLNWLVWLGPLAIAVGGIALLVMQRSQASRQIHTTTPVATAEVDEVYLRRVREELDR